MSVFNFLYRNNLIKIKNISNENIYTWYTFATEIFKEVELNKNNFEDFNKPFLLVKDTFKNTFKKNIKENFYLY
jgi:dTDP-4-dehydrorhamnose reductase